MFSRFLETATTSRMTLPAVCIYAAVMALSYGALSKGIFLQIGLLALTTYLMVLLNNKYSLMRIYSRMVSSSFLVLAIMCPFLAYSLSGGVAMLLFAGFYYLLFKTYQDHHTPGIIMYAFMCLGVIATQFAHIVFFLPLIWYIMYTRMFSGNTKSLIASIIGFLTPYWLWIGWSAWKGDFTDIGNNIMSLTQFSSPLDMPEGLHYLITLLLIALLAGIAIVQCLNESFADRIKTRMLYDSFIWIDVFAILFLLLQPQHHDFILRIIIVSSAPLIAHYFTLSESKFTQYVFLVAIGLCLIVTGYNTWM